MGFAVVAGFLCLWIGIPAYVLWAVIRALRTGEFPVRVGGVIYRRAANPIQFWVCVVLIGGVCLIFVSFWLALVVHLIGSALHPH
jgi:hypothetical protein